MHHGGQALTRTLEAGVTLFSAAQIRVVRLQPQQPTAPAALHPRPAAGAAAARLPPTAAAASHPQVLLPVGEAPEAVFQRYASLVVRHRQVELNNVRSFYKEAQKSPFKFFPWKQGNMHFRFLPVRRDVGCCDVGRSRAAVQMQQLLEAGGG